MFAIYTYYKKGYDVAMTLNKEMLDWRHVFKLDPDRELSDDALQRICQSGSDALIVGGSSGVTFDNTVDLLSRIRRFTVPCALEVSHIDAIVPGFDYYFIPTVLNANDVRWVTGLHQEAIRTFGARLPWHMMHAEGYIVMNPEATVAQLTEAQTELDVADVVAYARLAEKLFHLPIVYIEYSGVFGNMNIVKQVRQALEHARCFYGGGINSLKRAQEAAAVADTIVVGNVIYDDLEAALATVNIIEQR